jgi:hypothetical protein
VSQEAFLEESASLRAHVLALHAFATVSARAASNAMVLGYAAMSDVGRAWEQWLEESREAIEEVAVAEAALDRREAEVEADRDDELIALAAACDRIKWAEEGMKASMRCLTGVRDEILAYQHHLGVYRRWMNEESQGARLAILKGMTEFASGRTPDCEEPEEEECDVDEVMRLTNSYVHISLPDVSEIPACDSIGEAVQRLEETICPALREARDQFDLSWQPARADWPDGGAENYETNHYAELDRASQGFERILENLTRGLDAAMRDLPE